MAHVLVTGGAGFIGSFLVDRLIEKGESVRILDNLEEQVHHGETPTYLNTEAEFVRGDVQERGAMEKALEGIDTVIHTAAAVGVAQSQYEIKRYTDVNIGGTASLLDCIVNGKTKVHTILLPSSMTCYGEGVYTCPTHGEVRPGLRPTPQLEKGDFAVHCPECDTPVSPAPTPEDAELHGSSIYATTKHTQEELLFGIGRTYDIKVAALRLFNVYGPRQSLSNPYTGVAAIFLSRLKNGQPPVIYEDGKQSRDFISVHDVAQAFLRALESNTANGEVFNIGSGNMATVLEVAQTLKSLLGSDMEPEVGGTWRKGDVCHCTADISKAKRLLGWEPKVSFEDGMCELVEWSANEKADDAFAQAQEELKTHKLST
jgi:dTDP-L-rhamnose 4-epimerase